MKVSGTATLNAPAEQLFAALHDPAVLVRTIPAASGSKPPATTGNG